MLKVVELFAGVGGFRLGFERASKSYFKTVWANQWEPSRKSQYAAECYKINFGENNNLVCEDIAKVKNQVPEHDLLCGGFPCQDYSVAGTQAKGIEGKKGVLWWEIRDILELRKPKLVILENVDRLLKSPSKQRGRDFGIILRCFDDLGYAVEWKVVNAAEYGHPQKRRRIIIIGYKKESEYYKKIENNKPLDILKQEGILAKSFKSNVSENINECNIDANKYKDLVQLTNKFAFKFDNCGFMVNGRVYSTKYEAIFNGHVKTLREVLDNNVDEKYYIDKSKLAKWKYLKGAKKELRKKPNGDSYYYTEGKCPFPDNLDVPARTMLTSESSTNRSSHIILDPVTNRYRILTPEECEKINEFPVGWTDTEMPNKFRYFIMGNALVVGLFETIAKTIKNYLD